MDSQRAYGSSDTSQDFFDRLNRHMPLFYALPSSASNGIAVLPADRSSIAAYHRPSPALECALRIAFSALSSGSGGFTAYLRRLFV